MLAIRMQRTGRKGYATYRMIVQEAHRQPTSGRVVANLGSYNPHTKEVNIDTEKASFYLKNGAQPSDRVVYVLESQKVELPSWVKKPATDKKKSIKNIEKLRRNQPQEEVSEPAADVTEEVAEAPAEENTQAPEETPVEEVSVEEIAEAEVADGQETAEEEVAAAAEEDPEEKPIEA